jgi:HlyD family secretion protein
VSDKQKEADDQKIAVALRGVTSAQQSLDASQTNLAYQQQQAGQRQVFSPIDGTVNAINIKNGDNLSSLSSGSSRVVPMVIGDLSTIEAQVQVNEVDVPNVQIGQKVMMTFDAIPGLTVSGKVNQLDTLGTVTSGVVTYNANITLDTLDPRIKSGMSVAANIITGVEQDVITVPNSAIKTKGGTTYVQVLNSGQTTPSQVSVQIGVANNTDTEITSGLNVGDFFRKDTGSWRRRRRIYRRRRRRRRKGIGC